MRAKGSSALVAGALVAVLALGAVACSSSGSSGGASGTTVDNAANAALLGPKKPATGAPLKIGYIYAGQTQTIDDRAELAVAQATVKYVNDHLGGVTGRPLELVTCADQLTPSGATDCANQMLAAKVPVVLQSEPANPAPILKVLAPAKVPYFTWEGADAQLLTSPDSNVLGNPLIVLAGPIKLAKDDGVNKVAMIYVDVPAAAQLKVLGNTLFKNAGVGLVTTAVPLGTPDVTPQVQAGISAGAKEFLVIGDDSLCVNSLKALKTLAFTGKVVTNTNCLASSAAKALPGGFDGLVLATIASPDTKDQDVARYHAVVATYAPGTSLEGTSTPGGYATVMGFVRAMTGLAAGDVTPTGIAAQLKAMAPQPLPLLSTETFQCNRKVSSLTQAVCSNGGALITLDANGDVKQSESFDAAPYIKLG
jgi:branched-chain amino acid transport system substrate-binding protein